MLPEPTSAYGLWPKVKALSGWPQTDEEKAVALADAWTQAGTAFDRAATFSTGPGDAAWPDSAGREFSSKTNTAVVKASVTKSDTAQLGRAAASFAQLVTDLKLNITATIDANVTAYGAMLMLPPALYAAAEQTFVTVLANHVKTLMTTAAAQAATYGAVKVAAAPSAPGGPNGELPALPGLPPDGSTPFQVNAWWNSLSDEEQTRYVLEHPELIGGLNGIPATVRDRANRAQLGQQRAGLEAQLREMDAAGPPLDDSGYVDWSNKRKELVGKIDGIQKIQDALNSQPTQDPATGLRDPDKDGFFLLGLDTTDEGRFIVARGNPDTAVNVATFVPGSLTDLSQSGTLMGQGDALHRAAIRAGSPSTSVITWMDYNSPDSIPNAIFLDKANEAAPRLAEFQQGLRATHLGPVSHNSLVAHSYGSTVAGLSAANGNNPQVDEMIAAGSPGMGVQHATDLTTGRQHTWVIEHPKDMVADTGKVLPGQADPSEDGFGARVYNAEDGAPRPTGTVTVHTENGDVVLPTEIDQSTHDNYMREGSGSQAGLDRMGDIIAGRTPPN
ncbi:alpha/beta hydrolase [Kribbella sp. NPDC058245]|uniref:alpha/beta hydrolase n=1 Tax=Kribbella sp. NPDC058245 TaxID=3346399 RepID=UPI0036EEF0B9